MPVYEYHCQTCKERFEKMVRFSETDQAHECPRCHSRDTQKRVSLFASYLSGQKSASKSASCGSHGRFT